MRERFGARTLEAVYLVRRWPGSTHNTIANQVGRWKATGQDAIRRALAYELIRNAGTPRRFELYVTPLGEEALDNAWPLFSSDASRNPGNL